MWSALTSSFLQGAIKVGGAYYWFVVNLWGSIGWGCSSTRCLPSTGCQGTDGAHSYSIYRQYINLNELF